MDLANTETEQEAGRQCVSRHGGGTVAGVGGALGHVRSESGSEKEMGSQGEGCDISKDSASMGLTKAEGREM